MPPPCTGIEREVGHFRFGDKFKRGSRKLGKKIRPPLPVLGTNCIMNTASPRHSHRSSTISIELTQKCFENSLILYVVCFFQYCMFFFYEGQSYRVLLFLFKTFNFCCFFGRGAGAEIVEWHFRKISMRKDDRRYESFDIKAWSQNELNSRVTTLTQNSNISQYCVTLVYYSVFVKADFFFLASCIGSQYIMYLIKWLMCV